MRTMEVSARLAALPAEQAYQKIAAFEDYPTYTAAVRRVAVSERSDRCSISSWEVAFDEGILRWTEEDRFEPEARRIRFRQVTGDLEHFEGEWTVDADSGLEGDGMGCVVRFCARFDLGVPTLSEMLEPIAEQALRDNVELILAGLREAAAPAGIGGHESRV
ncbi:MAG TPA: SRPBCC family protein [Thermoanaerobaculia bacterium]|nr:SRPBCC family protein [Thermoanaerobaculia bacterium]